MAVEQVRAITGFDRVMAYRFRHDDSGDVVAEARRDDLEPYLGRRYPAGDIPAAGAPAVHHQHPAPDRRRRLQPVPLLRRAPAMRRWT